MDSSVPSKSVDEGAKNPYASETVAFVDAEHRDEIARHHNRNFASMAVYQIVMRAGWIFKTESVLMPAILDLISGAAWVRAMLPLLNRLGQSIPPMLLAHRVKVTPRKSRLLVSTTLTMATCFLLLALLWYAVGEASPWWMPAVFLAFYGLFFTANGVNQLVFGTTQGKLIEVRRRGRLLLVSSTIGAAIAVACALVLLPRWLHENSADVTAIFGFAAGCFFLSAVATLFLVEPADHYVEPKQSLAQKFAAAWQPIAHDRNFRLLALVAAMYGASMMLFPHYQWVGQTKLGLPLDRLIYWLILQNIGTGLFSIVAGPLADRFGNRLVLNVLMLGLCGGPLLALTLATWGEPRTPWYDGVFVLVGLTPIAFKTLQNYTLEICPPADHSRYLSAISLSMATPILLSPLMGWGIEWWGFEIVFLLITGMVFIGWCATFMLAEPRHKPPVIAVTEEID